RKANAQNDVTLALAAVEDAGAVTKSTGLRTQFVDLAISQVEDRNRIDNLRDLLPVSPDILHRGAADAAGNAAQASDSAAIACHGCGHKVVPDLARSHLEDCSFSVVALVYAAERYLHH